MIQSTAIIYNSQRKGESSKMDSSSASSVYSLRGASSSKSEVVDAVADLDDGIFPASFCKVVPDDMTGSEEHCLVMHADGAGTKAAVAYMKWKETGDLSVFEGIVQDSIVMNVDDLLCVGCVGQPILLSSTIGRNMKLIDGQVLRTLIQSNKHLIEKLKELKLNLSFTGGETADLGDLVRTVVVDSTVVCRMLRNRVMTNEKVKAGDVIIGLASFGQTIYEEKYNSGIGSNGLTLARHELLSPEYTSAFPETFDPSLRDDNLAYTGVHKLCDPLPDSPLTIGEALLSPTRTFYPIIHDLLSQHFHLVSGIIHCTGGGQTKCLKAGKNLHYVKNDLFPTPPIFREIMRVSKQLSWREMYQVFNMGHRMEIYGPPELVDVVQSIAKRYHLECKQIGHIEASTASDGEKPR